MTSTLTLYKLDTLMIERNFYVDDFSDFLNAHLSTALIFSQFQYQKLDDITSKIKITLAQDYASSSLDYSYNYCEIKENTQASKYFYIVDKKWKSTNCIELDLRLDTLNSFSDVAFGTAQYFDESTKILRRHKDRYYDQYLTGSNYAILPKFIDFYKEDLKLTQFTSGENGAKVGTGLENIVLDNIGSLFLVFMTKNNFSQTTPISQTNPVIEFYCSDKRLTIQDLAHSSTQEIGSLSDFGASNPSLIKVIRIPNPPEELAFVSGSTFTAAASTKLKFETINVLGSDGSTITPVVVRAYDRIENGYAPITREMVVPADSSTNLLSNLMQRVTKPITLNAAPFLEDPKLLHSEFTSFKYYYDSFSLTLPLEAYDTTTNLSQSSNTVLNFKLVLSSNVASKFSFIFTNFVLQSLPTISQDFPLVLNVARNNEVALYTDAYIEYLKLGYNYDMKAKNNTVLSSMAGILISATSMVAGLAVSALSAGSAAPVGAAMIIGGVAGLSSSMVSMIATEKNQQNTIDQRLAELQQQAANVSSADDSDLLQEYGGNALRYRKYSLSEPMQKIINKLFYYCGYSTNEFYDPTLREEYSASRMWFNFIQASIVWKDVRGLSQEILDDIKLRWFNGVTFCHANLIGTTKKWGLLDGTYENYETRVFMGLQ